MRWLRGFALSVIWLSAGGAIVAHAERYVVVNGKRLTQAEISTHERKHCGAIANGRYRYDRRSGRWAYAGETRWRGHITDNCRTPGRRPSLSERGMLFAPGELAR